MNKFLTFVLILVILLGVFGLGYLYITGDNPLPDPKIFLPDSRATIPHPNAEDLPDERDQSVLDAIKAGSPNWVTVSDIFGDNPEAVNKYISEYGVRNRPAVFLVTNRADALGQGLAAQTAYNFITRKEMKGGLLLEQVFTRVGLDYGIMGDSILRDAEIKIDETTNNTVTIRLTVHGCVVSVGIPITDLENPKPESDGDTLSKPSWWIEFWSKMSGRGYNKDTIRAAASANASASALNQILSGDELHQTFKESVEIPGPNHANGLLATVAKGAAYEWMATWCGNNPDKVCDFTKIAVNVTVEAAPKPVEYTFCGTGDAP